MMYKKLYDTGRVLVGLIIILALLFLCVSDACKNKAGANHKKGSKIEEAAKTESTEEPKQEELDPNQPMLALTFDDGPGKYTDTLLSILKENDAKATFMVLGSNVPKYPEAIKRMEELGCEIGNHTYSHTKLTELAPEIVQSEVEGTNDALKQVLGHGAALVRPPYGKVNEMVRTYTAYPLAFWSVDTRDWELKDTAAIIDYVLANAKDGDVVLLHDIHDFTVEAMKTVIPALKAQGYQLVTFSEMAKARGVTLENGQKYFNFR